MLLNYISDNSFVQLGCVAGFTILCTIWLIHRYLVNYDKATAPMREELKYRQGIIDSLHTQISEMRKGKP